MEFLKSLASQLQLLQPLLFILFVLFGWFFIRHNSHKFARRTERDGLINAVIDLNNDLATLAFEYWVKGEMEKEELELQVSNIFDRINFKLKVLKKYNIYVSPMELAIARKLIMSKSRDKDNKTTNYITYQKVSHKINLISNSLESSLLIKNTYLYPSHFKL